MLKVDKCPQCGSIDVVQEEVDIGVGIQYGPASCTRCGWNQQEELRAYLKKLESEGFPELEL